MAVQDAGKFLEALEVDLELAEKVRSEVVAAEESAVEAYVAAAREQGFDFTAEDLESEIKARQDAAVAAVDGATIDDAELEQISGGGDLIEQDECIELQQTCKNTYNVHENCGYNDKCTHVYHYYKCSNKCNSTYFQGESCLHNDWCDALNIRY